MDVFFENPGRSVESVDDDEIDQREEGSSHRGEDWKRMSLKRRTGSNRRRVGTWLSEKREEGSVYILVGVVEYVWLS